MPVTLVTSVSFPNIEGSPVTGDLLILMTGGTDHLLLMTGDSLVLET